MSDKYKTRGRHFFQKKLAASIAFSLAMIPFAVQADTVQDTPIVQGEQDLVKGDVQGPTQVQANQNVGMKLTDSMTVPAFRKLVSNYPYEYSMTATSQRALEGEKPNRITNQSFDQWYWIYDHNGNHKRITWAEYRNIASGESASSSGESNAKPETTPTTGSEAGNPGTIEGTSSSGNVSPKSSPIGPDSSSWQGMVVTRPQYADAISTSIKVTPPNPATPKEIPAVQAPTLPAEFSPAKIQTIDVPEVEVVPIPTKETQAVTVKELKAAKPMKSIVIAERNLKPLTVKAPEVMAPPTIGAVSVNQPKPLPVIDVPSFNIPVIPRMEAVQDVDQPPALTVNVAQPSSSGGGANPQSEVVYSWFKNGNDIAYSDTSSGPGVIQQGSIKKGSFDVTANSSTLDVNLTKTYEWEFGAFDQAKLKYRDGAASGVGGSNNTMGIYNSTVPQVGNYTNINRKFFYVLMDLPYSEFGKDVVINFDNKSGDEKKLIDFEMENRIAGTGYSLSDLASGNFIDNAKSKKLGSLESYSLLGLADSSAGYRIQGNSNDPMTFRSIVFDNKGTVNLNGPKTTYMFMTVDANANSRVQYLAFEGTINANGDGSVIMKQSPDSTPHSYTNYWLSKDATWNVAGNNSMGFVVTSSGSSKHAKGAFFSEGTYNVSGANAVGVLYTNTTGLSTTQTVVFSKPMEITGNGAIGFANVNALRFDTESMQGDQTKFNKKSILKMKLDGPNTIGVLQAPTGGGGWLFPSAVQIDMGENVSNSKGVVTKNGQFSSVDIKTENSEGTQFYSDGDVTNRVLIQGGTGNIALLNYYDKSSAPITLTFDGKLGIVKGTGNIIAYNNAPTITEDSNSPVSSANELKATVPEVIPLAGDKMMVAYTVHSAHTTIATNNANTTHNLLAVTGGDKHTLFYTSDKGSVVKVGGNVAINDVKNTIAAYTQKGAALNLQGDLHITNSSDEHMNDIGLYSIGDNTLSYFGNGDFSLTGGTNNRGVVARTGASITMNMANKSMTLGQDEKPLIDSVPLYASGYGAPTEEGFAVSSSIDINKPDSFHVAVTGSKSVGILADNMGGILVSPKDGISAEGASAPYTVSVKDGIGVAALQGSYVSLPNTHFTFTGNTTGIIAIDANISGDIFHAYDTVEVDAQNPYSVQGVSKIVNSNDHYSTATPDGSETYFNINIPNSVIDYKGKGYAIYTKNKGRINAENTKINLYSGVAFGLDFAGLPTTSNGDGTHSFKPVNFSNGTVNVLSNDAVLLSFINLDLGTLQVGNLRSDLLNRSFIDPASTQVVAGTDPITGKPVTTFKYLSTEGLTIDFDKPIRLTNDNIDTNPNIQSGESMDDYNARIAAPFFYKRIQLQRSKFQVHKDVSIHVNTKNANTYFNGNVIGLSMNANNQAFRATDSVIHLYPDVTVSAGRTDNEGRGGIGLYADYGAVTLDKGSKVIVEDPDTTSKQAVGIFAFNGSIIKSSGDILGYGPQAVGISEQAYKEDDNNQPIVDEFGEVAVDQGVVNITNSGSITLPGKGVLGIQAINNVPDSVLGEIPIPIRDEGSLPEGVVAPFERSSIDDRHNTIALDHSTVTNTGTITVGESQAPSGNQNGSTSVGIYGTRTKIYNTTFTDTVPADAATAPGIHLNNNSIGIYGDRSLIENLGTVVMKGDGNVGAYVTGDSEIADSDKMRVMYESTVPANGNNIGIFYHKGNFGDTYQTNATVADDGTTHVIHHYSDYNKIIVNGPEVVGADNVAVLSSNSDKPEGVMRVGRDPSNFILKNIGAYNYKDNTITLGKAHTKEQLYNGTTVDSGTNAIGLLSLNNADILNLGTIVNNGPHSISMMMNKQGVAPEGEGYKDSTIVNLGHIKLVGDHSIGLYLDNAGTSNIGDVSFDEGDANTSIPGRMAVFAKDKSVVFLEKLSQGTVGMGEVPNKLTYTPSMKNQDQYVYLDDSELSISSQQVIHMAPTDSPNPAVIGLPIFAYANHNSKIFMNDDSSLQVDNGIGLFFQGGTGDSTDKNTFLNKGQIHTKNGAIGAYFTGKNKYIISGDSPKEATFDHSSQYFANIVSGDPGPVSEGRLAGSEYDYDLDEDPTSMFTVEDQSIGMYLKDSELQVQPTAEFKMILNGNGLGMYVDSTSTIQTDDGNKAKMTLINKSTDNFGVGVYYVGNTLAADKDKPINVRNNPFNFNVPQKIASGNDILPNHDLVLNYLAKRAALKSDEEQTFTGIKHSLVYAMVDGGKAPTPVDPKQLPDTQWGSQFVNGTNGNLTMEGKLVVGAYVKQGSATNEGTMTITGSDGDNTSSALLVQNNATTYDAMATNGGTIKVNGNAVGMMTLGDGTKHVLNTGTIQGVSTEDKDAVAVRLSGKNTHFANVKAGDTPAYGNLSSDFVALYLDQTGAKTVDNGGEINEAGIISKAGTITSTKENGIGVFADNGTVDFSMDFDPKAPATTDGGEPTPVNKAIAVYMKGHKASDDPSAAMQTDKEIFAGHLSVHRDNIGLYAADSTLQFKSPKAFNADGTINTEYTDTPYAVDATGALPNADTHAWVTATEGATGVFLNQWDSGTIPNALVVQADNNSLGLNVAPKADGHTDLVASNTFVVNGPTVEAMKASLTTDHPDYPGVGVYVPKGSTFTTANANFRLNGGVGISGEGTMTLGDTQDHGVNVYFGDKEGVLVNVNNASVTLGKFVKTFGQGTLVQGDNLTLNLDLPKPEGTNLGAHNISVNYTDGNTENERSITNKGYIALTGDGQYGISAVVKDGNLDHKIDIFNGIDGQGAALPDSDAHIVTNGGKQQIGIKAQGASVYSDKIAVGKNSMGILMKEATPDREVHLYSKEIGINSGSIGIYNEGANLITPVHVGTIAVVNDTGDGVLDAVDAPAILAGTSTLPEAKAKSLVGLYMKGQYGAPVTYSDANINFGLASQSRGFSFDQLSPKTGHENDVVTVAGTDSAPNVVTLGESGMGVYASNSKTITVAKTKINLLGTNSIGVYAEGTLPGEDTAAGVVSPAVSLLAVQPFDAQAITADSASTVLNVDTKSTVINTVPKVNDTLLFAKNNALINLIGDGTWNLNHDVGIYANKAKVTTEAGKVFTFTMDNNTDPALSSTGAVVKDSSVSDKVHIAVQGKGSVGVQAIGAVGEVPAVTDLQGDKSLGYIINGLNHPVTTGDTTENLLSLPTSSMILSNGTGQIGIYTLKEGDAGYVAPADKAILATSGFTIQDKTDTTAASLSSIGIYNPGNYEIRNTGDIKVAGVATATDTPSIGIYSSGGDVTSTGTTTVGENSVGFYVKNHSLTNNGAITAQAGATGLYAVSDPVSQGNTPMVTQNGSLTTVGANSIGMYTNGIATTYKAASNGDGITVSAPTSAEDKTVYPSFGLYTVDAPSLNIEMKAPSGGGEEHPAVDSKLTVGTGATGVYAKGVKAVKANIHEVAVGDKGFGFLLKGNTANDVHVDTMNLGTESIGVFHMDGPLTYTGDINVGTSVIDKENSSNSKYSIGIYTSGNTSNLTYDKGTIVANKPQTFGIFGEQGAHIVVGKDAHIIASNGAYGVLGAENTVSITNYGTIDASGEDAETSTESTGIVAYSGTVDNQGVINVKNGAQGIFLGNKATLKNKGTINVDASSTALAEPTENKPAEVGSLTVTKDGVVTIGDKVINGGVVRIMNADAVVNLDHMKIDATVVEQAAANTANKVNTEVGMIVSRGDEDPSNILGIEHPVAAPEPISEVGVAIGGRLVADKVKGIAEITPAVTQGNNYKKIIIQNVFSPLEQGGLGSFKGSVISESASWIAKVTPVKDGDKAYMNVVMAKVPYEDLMKGSTPGIPEALEDLYSKVPNLSPSGQFFDRLDGYKKTAPFAYATAEIRGDLYANMNGQIQSIKEAFNRSYKTHENHYNFSKETNDWSLIHSSITHNSDELGVEGYTAKTKGVLFERESENPTGTKTRTISAGYGQTDFSYSGSVNIDSTSKVNTVVLGLGERRRLKETDHGHTDTVWTNRLYINHHDVTRQQNLPVSDTSDATDHFINKASFQSLSFETNFDIHRYEAWSPNRRGDVYGGLRFNTGRVGDIVEHGGALPLSLGSHTYFVAEPHVGMSYEWHKNITPQSRAYLKVAGELGTRLGSLYSSQGNAQFVGSDKSFAVARPQDQRFYSLMSATLGLNRPNHYGVELTSEYNSQNKAANYYLTLNYKWW